MQASAPKKSPATISRVLLQEANGQTIIEAEIRVLDGLMPEVLRWRDRDFLFRHDIGGRSVYSPPRASATISWTPETDGKFRS